jgi:hypothetical protein
VTIRLVPDENYKRYTIALTKENYARYLEKNIIDNDNIGLHF